MKSSIQQNHLKLPIPGGITVCVPNNLKLMTPYILLEQQDWYEDEIHFIRRLIEPGTAVIDIGANYGVYTLTAAKAVGSYGRVWAFEPTHATVEYLTESLAVNGFGQVELIRAALSDHEGEAHLSTSPNAELNTLNGAPEAEGETVSLTMLDAFIDQFSKHEVTFVKLDAEGEEPNVIAGGARFFAEQSPLVMFEIKDANSVNLTLVDIFENLGYACYRLIPGLNMLVPFDENEPVDPYQLNLFACKPDRARFLAARELLVETAPDAAPVPDDGLWHQWLSDKTWAADMLPQWECLRPEAWLRHRDALNQYVQSRNSSLSPAIRMVALKSSFDLLAPFGVEAQNLSHLSSLAHVAVEFGQRGIAVKALQQILALLQQGCTFYLNEPFLPPNPYYCSLLSANRLGDWILSSVVETLERLCRYSSFFGQEQSRKLLEPLAALGFVGEAAKRRLGLIRYVSKLSEIQV